MLTAVLVQEMKAIPYSLVDTFLLLRVVTTSFFLLLQYCFLVLLLLSLFWKLRCCSSGGDCCPEYSTSELSIGARIWSLLVTFIPFSTDRGGVGEDLIYTSHRILFCMSTQRVEGGTSLLTTDRAVAILLLACNICQPLWLYWRAAWSWRITRPPR